MTLISPSAKKEIRQASNSVKGFARRFIGITLYPYQQEAASAIVNSVFNRDGMTFVIIFCRQSGKDETLAVVFLFLMSRFIEWGIDIVCAQPTFKPQTINAMERLKKRGANFGRRLARTAGYIMRLGQARTCYFSAEPSANQVGATADRLLVMNEAQDIDPAVFDKRFSPMAASGYATKVFSGTSWTSSTLLAREKRAALEAEKKDGFKRVFMVDCSQVGRFNKYYQKHVAAETLKLGRNHPFIRTQYYCEEIDAQSGMFNAARRLLMLGDEPPQDSPPSRGGFEPPSVASAPRGADALANAASRRGVAFLLDVAGQDEARMSADEIAPLTNPGRDSVSLTIATIDLSSLETLQAPTYRFVNRQQWTGLNHLVIFGKLRSLMDAWQPQYMVMDATGVGEGLWAMLDKAYPGRVIPVKFSQQVKSELGWRFLAIIETGRVRDCTGERASSDHRPRPPQEGLTSTYDDFQSNSVRAQYDACQSEILPGPAKTLRWGVPEGTRGTDGELIHDDYLLADALVAELDRLDWTIATEPQIVAAVDPLLSMERNF